MDGGRNSEARLAAVLLWLLLLFRPGFALDPDRSIYQYGHDRWDHMKGLPSQAIYGIHQTPDGYLWLHSGAGLLRFDGVRFVPTVPELDGKALQDPIHALGLDRRGGLLLRTETRTLRLDKGATQELPPLNQTPDGRPHAILETRDGAIWIGTDNHLYRIRQGRMDRLVNACGYITAMLEDRQGTVWVSAASGLYRFKNEVLRIYPADAFRPGARYSLPLEGSATSSPRPKVPTALLEDAQGTLWMGSWDGLWKLQGDQLVRAPEAEVLRNLRISALHLDSDGNYWVGTEKNGLFRFAKGRWSNWSTMDGLSDDAVVCLSEDREGSLWIGTRTGLDRLRNTPLITMTLKEGLPSDNIYGALEARDGSIWAYSPESGVARIQGGRITAFGLREGLVSAFASCLFEASDGSIYVGSDRGLTRIQHGVAQAVRAPGLDRLFISAIHEDEKGLILAASDLNLYRLQEGRLVPYPLKLAPGKDWETVRYAFDIFRDDRGDLWFGLTAGLYHLKKGDPPECAVRMPFRAPAFSISDDGRGYLWVIGSQAILGGFARISKRDGTLQHFPAETGAGADAMGRFLFDDAGNPWINSRKGLLVFQRRDLEDYAAGRIATFAPRTFGALDGMRTIDCGLSTAQPSAWRARDGRMYFASSKGLMIVDPARLLSNLVPPPVQIEEVLANRRPLPEGTRLIPPGVEDLEIHYTALSLRVPDKVRFKYKLEGYDPDWVEAGSRRTAYYTRLAPGPYRFRVLACNDEGIWNETGASVAFTIQPRFVQTLKFYVLCAAAILALIILLFRLRTRQLRRRQQELQGLVEERTQALQAEIRERSETQERLIAYQDHLEHLVSERTAELQKANEALVIEEQRYRNFFEEDVAGAFIATPDGVILACNPAFARMLELPDPQSVVGLELLDFFEDPEAGRVTLDRVRREGKVLGCEIQLERGERSLHFIANLVGQLSPDGHHLVEIKGYVLDTTLRRDLEAQLRQSQKMEAIGQLAGGVAHDFNNLLTVILGYSEILVNERQGDDEDAYLAAGIKEAGERAAALTRQLLAFSRRQVIHPRDLNINATATTLEKMLRRLIGEHLHLSLELAPEGIYVKADPVQIEQIILNLVVNARDAMPTGGEIRLRTLVVHIQEGESQAPGQLAPGPYVCISVQDSGCGISPEILPRIFEPFFTTKGMGKGTGLGLSTVYGIVQQNGGRIQVQSEPGRGSTFQVLLPRIIPQELTDPTLTPEDIPRGEETILMVEDDELVRKMVQRTLAESGYQVLTAGSGPEALELARSVQGPLHLLLTDVVMPGMNGLQLALAMEDLHPGLPVLFMSGYMDEVLTHFGESLGGITLLNKPFTPVKLLKSVREMLDGGGTAEV